MQTEVELYSFFNLGVRWVGWLTPDPDVFTSGEETRYQLYMRLGGPQGPFGRGAKNLTNPTPSNFFTIRPEGHKMYNVHGQKSKGKNNISIYKFSYDILTFHQQFLLQHPLSYPFQIQFMQQYFRKKLCGWKTFCPFQIFVTLFSNTLYPYQPYIQLLQ